MIFRKKLLQIVLLALLFIVTACNEPASPSNTPTPTPTFVEKLSTKMPDVSIITPTETPTPTPEPTEAPIGEQENPIVLGIVYEVESSQSAAAQEFVQYLANETGYIFRIQSFTTYIDLLTAFENGTVSFAWLQPLTYLYAYRNDTAIVGLLTSNFGVYGYGSQFLVRSDSEFKIKFDPNTQESTGGSDDALRQFNKKRPCMVNDQSIEGYVVPIGLLNKASINYAEPAFQQSSTSVIRALYAGGICDYGVTFAYSGDPRTSSSIQEDLPDVMEKVLVAWRSDPVIPTLNVSFNTNLPLKIRRAIIDSILVYSKTPKGLKQLNKLTNYQIEALKTVDHDVYSDLNNLVNTSGIDLELFFGE
jgi:phosphonate transport system substrate-binding protein